MTSLQQLSSISNLLASSNHQKSDVYGLNDAYKIIKKTKRGIDTVSSGQVLRFRRDIGGES